jgi:hypothetical protein
MGVGQSVTNNMVVNLIKLITLRRDVSDRLTDPIPTLPLIVLYSQQLKTKQQQNATGAPHNLLPVTVTSTVIQEKCKDVDYMRPSFKLFTSLARETKPNLLSISFSLFLHG